MDFQKELEKYPDAPEEDKQELQKLASMQRDIAIGDSAEDFIRHPFFQTFQNRMNEMINDTKGEVAALLKKPGVTIGEVQGVQNGIDKLIALKQWLNSKVIAGRVGKQAIEIYKQDTEDLNQKIQEAVDEAQK